MVAAAFGAIVLNLPLVVLGLEASWALRFVSLPLAAVLYYLLWMVVRRVYIELQPEAEPKVRDDRTVHAA